MCVGMWVEGLFFFNSRDTRFSNRVCATTVEAERVTQTYFLTKSNQLGTGWVREDTAVKTKQTLTLLLHTKRFPELLIMTLQIKSV